MSDFARAHDTHGSVYGNFLKKFLTNSARYDILFMSRGWLEIQGCALPTKVEKKNKKFSKTP